jgi:hypothetical protein
MLLLTTLLAYSALVSAAPQVLNKKDLLISTDNRMSVAEVLAYQSKRADCWTRSHLVWPMNDTPAPIKDTLTKQLDIYKRPTTKPQTLIVRNFCTYDIHYQHLGAGFSKEGDLKAGGTFETPFTGTNWKASKVGNPSQVVQIEYNAGGDDLWYNLSLIDCLKKDSKGLLTKDASGCVGLEGGLQFGNAENMSFQCAPGTWCDDQAYFYYVSWLLYTAR